MQDIFNSIRKRRYYEILFKKKRRLVRERILRKKRVDGLRIEEERS